MTVCFLNGEIWTHREKATKMEDWRDASTHQATPKIDSKPPEAGKRQVGFPDRFRGSMALLVP